MNSLPVTHIVRSGPVNIHCDISGPETAPWLVLSNSLGTDKAMWDAQMSQFTKIRRVIRYDTRGHGQSQAGSPPYTFDMLSGDVIALMDHIGIKSADFAGLSLGGMTGLALAQNHPDRVNRLICCDARADAPAPYKAMWQANIETLHTKGIAPICAATLQRWFTDGFRNNDANKIELARIEAMFLGTSVAGYEGVALCLSTLKLLDGMHKIQSPTLYVVGEHDPAAPVEVMQAMADCTKHASLAVIEGAAHLSNIENPVAFTNVVMKFLQSDANSANA